MGAADYTIAGMEEEIADYIKVIAAMKAKMAAMPEEERQQVEEASKVLRRWRVTYDRNDGVMHMLAAHSI